jgi:RNA polymerase-binding transcription factor DksA
MSTRTHSELLALHETLVQRQQALRSEVNDAQPGEVAADSGAEVGDQKDQAAAWQRAEVDDAELQRDLDELAQVEQALHRLDVGIYGDCVDCGSAIPLGRLQVQPAALRCAGCQAAAERRR